MEIPGYIFILVGIAVSLTSYFSGMGLPFIIVGAGFVLWGLIKLVISRFKGPEKQSQKIPEKMQEIQPKQIKKEQSAIHMHPTVIACPSCGLKHYNHANYCQHCGSKMKK